MNTPIYTPYTYLVGWSKQDKWYYGAEYGSVVKVANPSNLWITYYTSSKEVKAFREQYGEPDVVQVRKTFKDEKSCRLWEDKVLTKLDVIHSDRWLNKRQGSSVFFVCEGHTDQAKEKMRGPRGPQSEEWVKNRFANRVPAKTTALKGRPSPIKGKKIKHREKLLCPVCNRMIDVSNYVKWKHGIECEKGTNNV